MSRPAVQERGDGTGRRPRVGVFGGSFDPLHNGHLAAASWAADSLELDSVLMVLAPDPWQKRDRVLAPVDIRWEMLVKGCVANPVLVPSATEIERDGPTYTIDTLEVIGGSQDLVLIIGADAARRIDTWHRSEDVLRCAEIAVVDRAGELPNIEERGWLGVELPRIDISSTLIRDRAARGLSVTGLVPAAVESIMRANGTYREPPEPAD